MRALWTKLAATAAVWMSLAGAAAAQQPTLHDDLLDRLVGRWTLIGTIAGLETTHDVTAEGTLNHQFGAGSQRSPGAAPPRPPPPTRPADRAPAPHPQPAPSH